MDLRRRERRTRRIKDAANVVLVEHRARADDHRGRSSRHYVANLVLSHYPPPDDDGLDQDQKTARMPTCGWQQP
jgi:hypothetical protein